MSLESLKRDGTVDCESCNGTGRIYPYKDHDVDFQEYMRMPGYFHERANYAVICGHCNGTGRMPLSGLTARFTF